MAPGLPADCADHVLRLVTEMQRLPRIVAVGHRVAVPLAPQASGVRCYQPTATTMYCGLVTEMSEDWPASSS